MSETKKENPIEALRAKQAEAAATGKVTDNTTKKQEEETNNPIAAKLEEVPKVEKTYHVFYSNIPSCRTVTNTGRVITFVGGRFVTDIQEDIDFLKREVKLGNAHISIVEGKETMTSDQLDPQYEMKKKVLEEFFAGEEAMQEAIKAGKLPKSFSELQKLTPASTKDVGDTAQQS